jgi:uncharacterized RDD family membrane protein YckC
VIALDNVLEVLIAKESNIITMKNMEEKTIYSGWWRRCAAIIIQSTLVGLIILPLVILGVVLFPENGENTQTGVLDFLVLVGQLIVFLVVVIRAQSKSGAWVDMKVMKIALVDEATLLPLTYKRALLRNLAGVLNSLPLGLGYLAPLFSKKKQTFADMLCKTVVIKTN